MITLDYMEEKEMPRGQKNMIHKKKINLSRGIFRNYLQKDNHIQIFN